MKRLVFALDLVDDREAIAEYEAWHQAGRVWPTVLESLRACGLENVEIFRTGNRLCLIMDAPETFCLEAKAAADAVNPEVQAWERLMWRFQRALPWAAPGQKWVPMPRMFSLAQLSATAAPAPVAEVATRRKPVAMHAPRTGLPRSESRAVVRGRAEFLAFRAATPTVDRSGAEHVARRSK